MERPLGVTLSAASLVLLTIPVFTCAVLLVHDVGTIKGVDAQQDIFRPIVKAAAFLLMVLAVWALGTAVGLLRLSRIAVTSIITMGVACCILAFGLIRLALWISNSSSDAATHEAGNHIVAGVLALAILFGSVGGAWLVYFSRESTRRWFDPHHQLAQSVLQDFAPSILNIPPPPLPAPKPKFEE